MKTEIRRIVAVMLLAVFATVSLPGVCFAQLAPPPWAAEPGPKLPVPTESDRIQTPVSPLPNPVPAPPVQVHDAMPSGTVQAQPLSVPLDKAYLIQPYDILEVDVWPYTELKLRATVRPDGTISYPMVGEIKVEGKTSGEVGDVITKALEVYVKSPMVAVNVENVRPESAYILGEVRYPGRYEIRRGDTVIDLISKAYGLTENAKRSEIGLIRAPKSLTQLVVAPLAGDNAAEQKAAITAIDESQVDGMLTLIDLTRILEMGKFETDIHIQDRDIVFVPKGKKVDWRNIINVVSAMYYLFRIDEIVGGSQAN